MTREQLEHLIRATAVITADDSIVVIGSQAILGQFPDAPESMRLSIPQEPAHIRIRPQAVEERNMSWNEGLEVEPVGDEARPLQKRIQSQ